MPSQIENIGFTADYAGPLAYSAADRRIFEEPSIIDVWLAKDRCTVNNKDRPFWDGIKNGRRLAVYDTTKLPGIVAAEVDGYPFVHGLPTSPPDPGSVLLSTTAFVPTTGFTVGTYSRAGGSSLSPLWSIPGDNGGALVLRHRSGDVIQLCHVPDATASLGTIIAQISDISTDLDLIEVGWDPVGKLFSIYIDNAVAMSQIPYDWPQKTQHFCLFGHFDMKVGLAQPVLASPRGVKAGLVYLQRGAVIGGAPTTVRQIMRDKFRELFTQTIAD